MIVVELILKLERGAVGRVGGGPAPQAERWLARVAAHHSGSPGTAVAKFIRRPTSGELRLRVATARLLRLLDRERSLHAQLQPARRIVSQEKPRRLTHAANPIGDASPPGQGQIALEARSLHAVAMQILHADGLGTIGRAVRETAQVHFPRVPSRAPENINQHPSGIVREYRAQRDAFSGPRLELQTLEHHLHLRQVPSVADSIRHRDGRVGHAAIGIAQWMASPVGVFEIESTAARAGVHHVVPTGCRHVLPSHAAWNLDAVDYHLQHARNFTGAKQHFDPRQVAIVAGEHHGRMGPHRAIVNRHKIVEARLILRHARRLKAGVAMPAHQDTGRHEFDSTEARRGAVGGILVEHTAIDAGRASVVAACVRLAGVQIARPARLLWRIAAPVEQRVCAAIAAIHRLYPLCLGRGKSPGASPLNAHVRQEQALRVQPAIRAQTNGGLVDFLGCVQRAAKQHDGFRDRQAGGEIEEAESRRQLRALETGVGCELRERGVGIRQNQRHLGCRVDPFARAPLEFKQIVPQNPCLVSVAGQGHAMRGPTLNGARRPFAIKQDERRLRDRLFFEFDYR